MRTAIRRMPGRGGLDLAEALRLIFMPFSTIWPSSGRIASCPGETAARAPKRTSGRLFGKERPRNRKMHQYRDLFRLRDEFMRHQISADYTIRHVTLLKEGHE